MVMTQMVFSFLLFTRSCNLWTKEKFLHSEWLTCVESPPRLSSIAMLRQRPYTPPLHRDAAERCGLQTQGNFEKPDQEEIEQTMKETAAALNLVVSNKLQAAQPKTVPKQPGAPTFIKYTPSQQGPQYASGSRERTIKMQDMPVDPMEPPKFRHKKVCHFEAMARMAEPAYWRLQWLPPSLALWRYQLAPQN